MREKEKSGMKIQSSNKSHTRKYITGIKAKMGTTQHDQDI